MDSMRLSIEQCSMPLSCAQSLTDVVILYTMRCITLCRPTLAKRLGGHLGTPDAKQTSSSLAAAAGASGDAGADTAAKTTRCASLHQSTLLLTILFSNLCLHVT